jgi:hypothetical protein
MPLLRNVCRAATATLLLAAAADLVAARRGWLEPRAPVLGALVVLLAIAAAATLGGALFQAARGPRRVSAGAEALAAAGLLAIAAGGITNWVLAVQGFVLLREREPFRLSRTADIQAFTHGPLADLRELDLTIALGRLELAAAGEAGFRPVSRLRVLDAAGEEVGLTVSRGEAAPFRTLVFRQGAFGFAPRVVVMRDGRELLDTYVPFRTIREGPDGVSFVGDFELSAEKLLVHGAITLEDLDDDMKGHPDLELSAERDGRRIGAGKLRPGEFAAFGDGYRIAFAGLQRWSEIDFSRRSYPVPMLGGLAALAAGVLLWPVAAWRRW